MQINVAPPSEDTTVAWINYIHALWDDPENTKRKEASKLVVDYYKNNQRRYLESELKRIYTDPHSYAMKRKWTQNITKQIIDALAQCYSCKVKRVVPNLGKRNSEALSQKVFTGINKKMRNANKWLVLERSTLLFARWNSTHSRVDYRSYHQFEFDVVTDPSNPDGELMAVILSDFKPLKDANIVIYTPNRVYQFKGKELRSLNEHNLGVLPFVLLHAEDPGFEDYLDPDLQLANSNLEINVAISNLLNIHQNQAHAVPVLTVPAELPPAGIDDANPDYGIAYSQESDRRLDIDDPDKALVLQHGDGGETPDFKYVTPQVNFDGAVSTIKYVVNSLAQTYGVDNGIFNIEVSGNPATVFHVNEKRREAIVGDLQSVFMDAEKSLFKAAYRLASQADSSIPDLDPETFFVEFVSDASIVNQLNSGDINALWKDGAIDQVELVRHHYGDKSRAEAEAFIEEMLQAEARIKEIREKLMPAPVMVPGQPNSPEPEESENNEESQEE